MGESHLHAPTQVKGLLLQRDRANACVHARCAALSRRRISDNPPLQRYDVVAADFPLLNNSLSVYKHYINGSVDIQLTNLQNV